MEIRETITLDSTSLRQTADGYVVAEPKVARTGIQLYSGAEVGRPDMSVVRVYRPETEVFSRDSLHSFAFRPVTREHPPEPVTSDNWRRYAVGQTGGEVVRDGEFVKVPLVLMDRAIIEDVMGGQRRELSLGYTTELKWDSGTTPTGEAYDAIQTNIRANHLAVVQTARGGPELKLGDEGSRGDNNMPDNSHATLIAPTLTQMIVDGLPVEMTDMAAKVVGKHLDAMKKQIDQLQAKLEEETGDKKKANDAAAELQKTLETKDAEIATLKQQLADAQVTPDKLDAMVKDRATVVEKATKLVGDGLVVDGKTVSEIRRQVVESKLGDAAKGWSDDQVSASFNTLTASDGAAKSHTQDRLASAFGAQTTRVDARDAAYTQYVQRQQNMWRGQSSPNKAS